MATESLLVDQLGKRVHVSSVVHAALFRISRRAALAPASRVGWKPPKLDHEPTRCRPGTWPSNSKRPRRNHAARHVGPLDEQSARPYPLEGGGGYEPRVARGDDNSIKISASADRTRVVRKHPPSHTHFID